MKRDGLMSPGPGKDRGRLGLPIKASGYNIPTKTRIWYGIGWGPVTNKLNQALDIWLRSGPITKNNFGPGPILG